jgi:hypothetical protein
MPTESPRVLAAGRPAAILLTVALAVAACAGTATPAPGDCVAAPAPPENQEGWTTASTEPTILPLIVNSAGSLTCGRSRLLFTFLDAENRTVASPDRACRSLYNRG